MQYADLIKQNASIMEAYLKMQRGATPAVEEAKAEENPEVVVEAAKEETENLEEGIGDTRERYALHRAHGSTEGHTHAIVHKMDHSNVVSTFPDRNSAVEHLDKSDLSGTHRVVSIESTHKLRESTDEEDEKNINGWMDSVKAAHPGKSLKFKNRIESGTHTTSAEVTGEDRSYGVWDHDKKEGHVFHESVLEESMTAAQKTKREEIVKGMKSNMDDLTKRYGKNAEQVMYATATKKALEEAVLQESPIVASTEQQPTADHYTAYGRKFATYSFPNREAANGFMQTPQGEKYGYIGMDDKAQFHVAHMDDEGTTHVSPHTGDVPSGE